MPGRFVREYTGPERLTTRLFLLAGLGVGWMYWLWCHGARADGRIASQTMACEGGSVAFLEGYVAVM